MLISTLAHMKDLDALLAEKIQLQEKIAKETTKIKKAALSEAIRVMKEKLHQILVVDGVFILPTSMSVQSDTIRLVCTEMSTTHFKKSAIRYVSKPTDDLAMAPRLNVKEHKRISGLMLSTECTLQTLFPDGKEKKEKVSNKKEKTKK